MRKRVHELNRIPTEFHEDGAPELPPLPDEFNRFPNAAPKKEERSHLRKVMLYLAAAAVVLLGVIRPTLRLNPPAEAEAVPPAAQTAATTQDATTPQPPQPSESTAPATPAPTAEPTAEPEPMADCEVVYFFTHSVSHGAVMLTDPAHTTAVHVRLWSDELNDGLINEEWTAEEIAAGKKEYYGLDVNDFYGRNLEQIEQLGEFPMPALEATVTYQTPSGEESVTRRAEPSGEDYAIVWYYDDGTIPTDYAFPGCFTAWAYSSPHDTVLFTADPDKPLERGEICVLVSVDGQTVPDELCHVEERIETYEYDGEAFTDRSFIFVMQRPDSFPLHGTAQVLIRQRLVGFDYIFEYTDEIEY